MTTRPDPVAGGAARRRTNLAGDRSPNDAITAAYRIHADAVFATAYRIGADRQAAAEITNEVFLTAWRTNGFDPARGSMRTYLCVMARNRAVDWIRSQEASRRRDARLTRLTSSQMSIEDAAARAVERRQIREALAALPAHQRKPIQLAFYEHLTYVEVAQKLEIPEGTAKSRIRDGFHRLRTELAAIHCET